MRSSPRMVKIIISLQILIVLIIRFNIGYDAALWSLIPVISLGLLVSYLIGRSISEDTKRKGGKMKH